MNELFHIPPNQISALLALAKSPEMEEFGIIEISFRRADLQKVSLVDVVWTEIDLEEADLSNASLQNSSLQGANLGRAKLRAIDLSNADLREANFIDADLREAILIGANLRNASLQSADLRESDLRRADLRGTNLDGARLDNAIYDGDTKWPTAFNVNSSKAVRIPDPVFPVPEVTFVDMVKFVNLALRQRHNDRDAISPLASLHLFQNLRQSEAISEHETTNRILHQGLQLLDRQSPKEAKLLRYLYIDGETNDFVSNHFSIAPSTLYRYTKRAIEHLAMLILDLEEVARKDNFASGNATDITL